MILTQKKHILLVVFFTICGSGLLAGCEEKENPINNQDSANTILLNADYGNGIFKGNFPLNIWSGDHKIYATSPLRYYELDEVFHRVYDSVLFFSGSNNTGWHFGIEGIIYMRFNTEKSKLLCVKSKFTDVSMGNIEEIDIQSMSISILLDSTNNVSSALYINDDSIIYYSYGSYSKVNTLPIDAGYYLYVRSTGKKQILLHSISSLGPGEIINGFDYNANHHNLLIPSTSSDRAPLLIEFKLSSNRIDTLALHFQYNGDVSRRWYIFVRYNHNGSKILYNLYSANSLNPNNFKGEESETGIIETGTYTKKILKTNPFSYYLRANCIFPDWSPDENSIVYGSAGITDDGYLSNFYQPTILKTIY